MPDPRRPSDFDEVLNQAVEAVAENVRRHSLLKVRFRRGIDAVMKPVALPKEIDPDEDEDEEDDEEG